MKKSDELKQERYALIGELRKLPNSGLEERKLETRETELNDKIHELSGQIIEAEKKEKRDLEHAIAKGRVISSGDEKDLEKYSFARAIRIAAGLEKHDGIEAEMAEEAKREMSGIGKSVRGFGIPSMILNRASTGQNVATAADGGLTVGSGGVKLFEALKNKLVLTQLGATFLTGLQGPLPLVGSGTFSAQFVAEGAEITKTKASFADRGTLTPRRLGSLGAISRELIYQSSVDVERIIVNELVSSLAHAIEGAAINGPGTGANPTGILNYVGIGSVTLGDNGASLAWGDVVELESTVKQNNGHGQHMGYLTNSKVVGKMKTTLKSAADLFIMENNMVNGYKTLDTNAVPSDLDKGTSTGVCSALLFGAWENMIIGQWGGLDLIADPYTRKAFGEIELNTNQFIDVGVSNPAHFAAIKDVLTA